MSKVDLIIETLIKEFPLYVNWDDISKNKHISWNFITKHIHSIKFDHIIKNKNVAFEQLLSLNIPKEKMQLNPNITMEYIWSNFKYFVPFHKNIYLKINETFINLVKEHINWSKLCQYYKDPEYLVVHYPSRIDKMRMSKNINITPEFIDKYSTMIVWCELIWNPSFTKEFLEKNNEKLNWNIFVTKDMPFQLFEPYLNRIAIESCSQIYNVPLDVVEDLDGNTWSRNPNLTESFIYKHVNEINWDLFSRNTSLNLALIRRFDNRLHWSSVWRNSFNTNFVDDIEKPIEKQYVDTQSFNLSNYIVSLVTIGNDNFILVSNIKTYKQEFFKTKVTNNIWEIMMKLQQQTPVLLRYTIDGIEFEVDDLIIRGHIN